MLSPADEMLMYDHEGATVVAPRKRAAAKVATTAISTLASPAKQKSTPSKPKQSPSKPKPGHSADVYIQAITALANVRTHSHTEIIAESS